MAFDWFLRIKASNFGEKPGLDKDHIIFGLLNEVSGLKQEIQLFKEEVRSLNQKLTGLKQENTDLRRDNASLLERLNRNSRNSNQPPSLDGFKKQTALPKTSQGIKGGQKGHKGKTLKQTAQPDKIIECNPEKCSCGYQFTGQDIELAEKRQVFDLPVPKLEVTEYRIQKGLCPQCGIIHKGIAPEGVNAPVQYGKGVKAYSVLLNVYYKLPYKKIQQLFYDLYGYPINESTIVSASEQCYHLLANTEQVIMSRIAAGPVTHADETGFRVNKRLNWLHTATSLMYTYLFTHEKRGRLALESAKSILGQVQGWLVHDCWEAYFNFTHLKHGTCNAHILRELDGLVENFNSRWAVLFKTFLLQTWLLPFDERVKRRNIIEQRYRHICGIADKLEPPPWKTHKGKGKHKRTKGRNLLLRLIKHQQAVLAFAFNSEVPFTNNLAERDIRPAKVKLKISNCFRTMFGAEIYARIEGFVSTTRKHQRNVFSELLNTFEGKNFITT